MKEIFFMLMEELVRQKKRLILTSVEQMQNFG